MDSVYNYNYLKVLQSIFTGNVAVTIKHTGLLKPIVNFEHAVLLVCDPLC